MDVLARERPCHGATAGRADEGGERRTSRMIMPCSRPPLTRWEEEGRGAEVGRIVSASEEEGREAKIREKIQPRYRWPAVSSLKGCRCTFC